MKYKMDVQYKGLSYVMTEGKEAHTIDIPGDVTVHVEGECSWIETLFAFRLYKKTIKMFSGLR